ncbi:cytochrome P450 4C1-like [Zerene cesonia]|uniref:cytochrome P450 4C1-like n=1 Tax=Zerene cesonia TaxID=33412 RepID=UPI0018E534C6|nr:cytochrome P450 4C1-like [Zerene cesonia]XP_038222732.1 cytochrome P450 4C1-like [Zerene cesonia]
MYLSLLLCVILLICIYIVTLAISWRARKNYAHLPTYTSYPFIGAIYKFYGDTKNLFNVFNEMTMIAERSNKPFAFWAGPVPLLVLNDPDDIRVASNAFVDKPYYYSFARVWLGDGLVTAPGWIWKKNVKKVASTFIGPAIDNYQLIFNERADKLVKYLKPEVDGDFFDSMPHFSLSTMETICQAGLGVSKISENFITGAYYKAFTRTLELIIQRGMNLIMHSELIYRLTPAYKELMECVSVLHSLSGTVIEEKKIERKLNESGNKVDIKNEEEKINVKSFLDLMLDLNEKDASFTESQVLAEINTIILAGQETVATTLFYTLLVIGSRKDVQENIHAEIKRVLGDRRDVQKDDLAQLSYCEAVINESLRLYPPVVGVLRYADHDLKLKSVTVTKGTTTVLNIWGAARSPRCWGPDAEEFKPERWLPPNNPCVNAHLPFSTGKRACIGKRYAMAFLKTILVHVLRQYEIISQDNFEQMEFKLDVALRPVSGHLMKLRLRD